MKYCICSCFLFFTTIFCFSQTEKITGKIVNENNIALVNATILAKQNNIIKAYTQSDVDGYFNLTLLVNQKYVLQITSVGYKKSETEIIVTETPKEGIYTLEKQIKTEDTVRISAKRGYYENGDTIFYNTDVYKRNNENNLKDLLNNLPGIEVTSAGKIVVDGQTVEKVLIDGKDLTGDNYEKIINNLSPHGLDQIQVLKKYNDPFSLTSAATGDTELAINLTFKKKKLIPNIKLSLGLGLPIDYFEEKTDFLITNKYVTGLCFINWNTIGNTFQFIASPNEILGSYKPGAFSKLGRGLSYFNGVNEIYLPITKNLYSFNNSKYFDNSSQITFSKRVTDKITITYAPEKVEQTENKLSNTFNGNQVFSETKSLRNPALNNNRFIVKNELIWMLKNTRQVKVETNFEKQKFNATTDGLLNNKEVKFYTGNAKTIFRNLVNFTSYLKKSRLFNAAFFYEYEKNKEMLNSDGVAYDGILFSNVYGITRNLSQQKANDEHNIGGYLKLIQHGGNYSITIQPTYKYVKGNLFSNLSATSTTGYIFNNIDSFHNQFDYSQSYLSLPIRYKYNDNHDNIDFSINVEPFILSHQKFHDIKSFNYFNFNADADLKYKFKNKKTLTLRTIKSYTLTNVENVMQNNIVKRNTSILIRSALLTNSQNYNFSATFQNNKFTKKSKNTYNVSYSINEPNYISNSTSYNLFSYNNFLPFINSNKSFNSSIRNDLLIKKLKLRLENKLSFVINKGYTSQNNNLVNSTTKFVTYDCRIKSKFDNFFNFDWNNSFSFFNSKTENNPYNYSNYVNNSNILININYRKKTHIDFSLTDFYFYTPYNNKKTNLFFANVSVKQLLNKNKIRLTLELNNITNKRKFSTQTVTTTQYNEVSTSLIPFYALAKIEFLL